MLAKFWSETLSDDIAWKTQERVGALCNEICLQQNLGIMETYILLKNFTVWIVCGPDARYLMYHC